MKDLAARANMQGSSGAGNRLPIIGGFGSAAQLCGQFRQIVHDKLPVIRRHEIRDTVRAELFRARDEGRHQAAAACGGQVAVVCGDQTDLVRRQIEDGGRGKIRLGKRLVSLRYFGPQNGIPGQSGALGHSE